MSAKSVQIYIYLSSSSSLPVWIRLVRMFHSHVRIVPSFSSWDSQSLYHLQNSLWKSMIFLPLNTALPVLTHCTVNPHRLSMCNCCLMFSLRWINNMLLTHYRQMNLISVGSILLALLRNECLHFRAIEQHWDGHHLIRFYKYLYKK